MPMKLLGLLLATNTPYLSAKITQAKMTIDFTWIHVGEEVKLLKGKRPFTTVSSEDSIPYLIRLSLLLQ